MEKCLSKYNVKIEVVIAASALLLSISTVATSAWLAIRGSEITAVQPSTVLFYKDGTDAGAVLSVAVDSALVNSASSNFGDVVTDVAIEIVTGSGSDNPRFYHEALITPVFAEDTERRMSECPIDARCVRNGQLLVIETAPRTLDVPGGGSRSEYLGFVIYRSKCANPPACEAFRDFPSSLAHLAEGDHIHVRFHYHLLADGQKIAECRGRVRGAGTPFTSRSFGEYVAARGWAVLRCEARAREASVLELILRGRSG